ncbi:MAG: hypothetical protein V8S58_02665 [Lachnospiraceae bacterium]
MILFGYASLITMLLSQISGSSSAAFAIMFPIIFAMCAQYGIQPFKKCSLRLVLYPLQLAQRFQSVGARTFAQYNGFLESNGAEGYQLGFLGIR